MMLSARGLQALVKTFEDGVDPSKNAALFQGQFIASPVLLTFAMELALKAWWAKDYNDIDIPRTHDLLKLFDGLKEDTRTDLESAHPEVPHPIRGFQPLRPGLRSILASTSAAFVEWRYLHEYSRARFPNGAFNEALSSVIREFYRTAI